VQVSVGALSASKVRMTTMGQRGLANCPVMAQIGSVTLRMPGFGVG
jgi:hypothetical protein